MLIGPDNQPKIPDEVIATALLLNISIMCIDISGWFWNDRSSPSHQGVPGIFFDTPEEALDHYIRFRAGEIADSHGFYYGDVDAAHSRD